jgi:ABC-2 type transport system permease protein
MSSILTIFKKELKGFYFTPAFWVICFLCSLVFSWSFPIDLNRFAQFMMNYVAQQQMGANQLNIHYSVFSVLLVQVNLLLIIVTPALTMKLFAEERRMRTFDLLLTSPVTSAQIVIGKYFAALGAIAGIIFIAFLYPLSTAIFVKFNWGPLLIAFLGIFLMGAVYLAMDLFASSLTESAVGSFVVAIIFNISIWFVSKGAEIVDGEKARKIFEHISLSTHLSGLVEGTIRTNGLIFFLSIIVLFCFLAERVVESSRWR